MLGLSNAFSSSSYIPFSSTKSLSLDGSNDHADCGAGIDLGTGDFSISFWVKLSEATNQNLLSKFETANDRWLIRTQGTDKVQFMAIVGSSTIMDVSYSGDALSEDEWHHVVVTCDRSESDGLKIYVDKVVGTTGSGSITNINNDGDLYFGRENISFSAITLDEAAIWNSALPATAVIALYNDGNPTELTSAKGDYTAQANLVAWWRMGDGAFDNISVVHDQVNPGLGAELVVNGDFAIASGAGVGWTAATSTNIGETTGGYGYISKVDTETLSQAGILEVDKSYYYTFIAKSGNEVGLGHLHISGASATWRQIEDVPADWTTYSGCIRADNVNFTFSESSHGNIYIDNVSVKEVNGNPALIIGGVSSFSNSFSNSFN